MTDVEGAAVGFVGLGTMGNPMALNLVRAGCRLTVNDVRRDAADNLVEAGARWAESPTAVAEASAVTFLSLPTPSDVEAVVTGSGGVLAGAAPGSVIVDLSTNSPAVVRGLAAKAAEQQVAFLDAPVSGGQAGARRGTLAVMVGGDRAAFDRCRSLLDAIGERIFYLGGAGGGSVAKLVNNLLFLNGVLTSVEAMVTAAKAGVDLGVLREVVQAGSGGSFVWDYATKAIGRDRLGPTFSVALATKDADLAVRMAEEVGAAAPTATYVRDRLLHYRANGFAADDVLGIVKAFEEAAGTVVRGVAGGSAP